jgi:ABC-type glycerol-3-phosphate transport system substrate-binding protein
MTGKKVLLMALVIVTSLVGCVAQPPPTPTTEPMTIVFASRETYPGSIVTLKKLASQFQDTQPHITVEVQQFRSRAGMTMKDIAEDADCFNWSPSFQEPGSVEDIISLDPFLEAEPRTADDFYPSLLKQFNWQGQTWGLPGQAMPYVIKYNRALFDAIGVNHPAPNWTTDDFLELAIALTRGEGENKQYGFVAMPFDIYELVIMLERRGGDLMDESVDPPTVALNNPSTVEALRWYANLTTKYGVKPAFATDFSELLEEMDFAYQERQMLIRDGRAAMWNISEIWELRRDPEGLRVGVAPMPAGAGRSAGAYTSVSGYFISAHTEARQACWEWITYLTEQPEGIWAVPARRSVAESEAYCQQVGAEQAAAFQASVAGVDGPLGSQFGDHPWLILSTIWLFRAHNQVVEGKTNVEEALDAAQRTFDDFRACLIAQDAFSDQEQWLACLAETDPELADVLSRMDD